MAKNYNNVKCEGCIHLGQFGNCWMGETPAECNNKMTIEQAIGRLNGETQHPNDEEQAAREYADGVLRRTDPEFAAHRFSRQSKMQAAMFNGTDIEAAFLAGASWRAQHPDK